MGEEKITNPQVQQYRKSLKKGNELSIIRTVKKGIELSIIRTDMWDFQETIAMKLNK